MADNIIQFRWIATIKENLELLFSGKLSPCRQAYRSDVFVAGELFWYPDKKSLIQQATPLMHGFL